MQHAHLYKCVIAFYELQVETNEYSPKFPNVQNSNLKLHISVN